jgi:hypothetical protein
MYARSRGNPAVALASIALVLVMGSWAPGGTEPNMRLTASGGSLALSSSRDGSAIFTAAHMAPGHAASGTVTIRNTGTLWGALRLSASGLTDVPGAGGGFLSGRLRLTVREVTGTVPATVYAGPLATMPARALGLLGPGRARRFAFAATMPDGGAPASPTGGDNAFANASTSVRYRWSASQADPPRAPARDTRPPRLGLRVPRSQPASRRGLVVKASCDEGCRLTVYAWTTDRRGVRRFVRGIRRRPLPAGRLARFHLRLPATPRAILRSSRRRALRVVALAEDAAGNRTRLTRRVGLRPRAR